jgi:hypothetical protein
LTGGIAPAGRSTPGYHLPALRAGEQRFAQTNTDILTTDSAPEN